MTVKDDIIGYNKAAERAQTYGEDMQWGAWQAATSDPASNTLKRVTSDHQAAVAQAIHDSSVEVLGLYGVDINAETADDATVRAHLAAEGMYDKDAAETVLEEQDGRMSTVGNSIVQRHAQQRQQIYNQDRAAKFRKTSYQEQAREELRESLAGTGVVPKDGQSLDDFLAAAPRERLEQLADDVLADTNFNAREFAQRYRTVFDYAEPAPDGE